MLTLRVAADTFAAGAGVLDPKYLIKTFGTLGILAIVFAETGLLIGFFLPGDSLLFTAGIFSSSATEESLRLSLPVITVGVAVAAIAGAQVGYLIGRKAGPVLFERPESRFFRREYVEKAESYFIKFGPGKAVVLARFIPVVRTFLNPVAGVLGMNAWKFFQWNVIGGLLWAVGVTLLGYTLGATVPSIDKYLLPAVGVIIVVSLLPVVLEVLKARREQGRRRAGQAPS